MNSTFSEFPAPRLTSHLAWPGLITVVPVEPFWLLDIMEIGFGAKKVSLRNWDVTQKIHGFFSGCVSAKLGFHENNSTVIGISPKKSWIDSRFIVDLLYDYGVDALEVDGSS